MSKDTPKRISLARIISIILSLFVLSIIGFVVFNSVRPVANADSTGGESASTPPPSSTASINAGQDSDRGQGGSSNPSSGLAADKGTGDLVEGRVEAGKSIESAQTSPQQQTQEPQKEPASNLLAPSRPRTASGTESVNDILGDPSIDWKDPEERAQAVARMKAAEERGLARAREIAVEQGLPLREEFPDGGVRELVGIDEDTGELLYYVTRNANAAISSAANLVHPAPYNLDGTAVVVGVWDGGAVRTTHQEFQTGSGSRATVRDGFTTLSNHAVHVAGTVAAAGIVANAKGMAPNALVDSYHWTSDDSEMTAAGATAAGQSETLVISNHSYGYARGWNGNTWRGTGTDQNAYAPQFGQYTSKARSWDLIAYNSPYYLIFHSAGNDNSNNPSNGSSVVIGGNTVTYDRAIHPPGDGLYRNTTTNSANGYENIGDQGNSKNIMVVGAANDAVTSGLRDPSKSTLTSFSSRGPTDDGRIKPDIVANGASLYSTSSGGDTSYSILSGTSMSSPSAAGSAALLVHQYRNLFPGGDMRASTLKGLILHTATDIGNPGPDYHYGWGLINTKEAVDHIRREAEFPGLEGIIEDQVTTVQPTQSFTFSWDGVSPIRATLCWTDPAASSTGVHDSRVSRLVNDLNLKLVAPDGTEYFPFVMPYVGTWTVASMSAHATTGVNNTDNVEQVLVSNPGQSGLWRAEVSYLGTLTNNSQDFGLIVSGAGLAGTLVFDSDNFVINEDSGTATIMVNRSAGSSGAVSVDYATSDGSAMAGSDYTAASGTLNWADGEEGPKTLNIAIIDDATSEDFEEMASITLSNPTGGATIGGTNTVAFTIVDDEPFIGVITPNGSESLSGGSPYSINWVSALGGSVSIELLKNDILFTTIASSTANDGSYSWNVPQWLPTGGDYRIRITNLAGGGASDISNTEFSVNNSTTNIDIYRADMNTDPGWTLQGDWAYGIPLGGGGQSGNPDPASGNTGSNVIGYNLSGDYANNLAETSATTTAIDCSELIDVRLSFYRWLNVEQDQFDNAYIRVSSDGTNWTEVWSNSATLEEASWNLQTYDISAVADGQSTVYVRWVMGTTDGSLQYSGWNIDDVVVSGLGDYVNPAGSLGFGAASYTVSEGSGTAVVLVNRTGGSTGAISVDYASDDGTAVAGVDYTAVSGTLNWADGDSSARTINIPLLDDGVREDFLETLHITLNNTVGATILAPNPVTIDIQDDDNSPPTVNAGPDQTVAWQEITPTAGLYYGTVPGDIDTTTPNPQTRILINVGSETENSIDPNTTEIYTGLIYDADGQISFTENIDDKARIWIDGVLVLSNDSWSARTSTANLNLAPGWHSIEIRISNGNGGSGPAGGIGIGYDSAGGTNWQTLVDPGDGSFLKVNQDIPRAEAILDGSVSDLDGDPVTTAWTLVSGPGTVTFDDSSTVDTTAEFDARGVYTLRLTSDDGISQAFDEVTITVAYPPLAVSIADAEISEDGGTTTATISRSGTSGDLQVSLSSDDTGEASVTSTVTIPDGSSSVNATITGVPDGLPDGTQAVTITATATGFSPGSATLNVTDAVLASYAVTYNGNGSDGGTVPVDSSSPYAEDAEVTVLGAGTMSRSGYKFGAWNSSSDGSGTSYTPGQTFNISSDTTLYAIWTATFDLWAGGLEPDPVSDTNGDGVSDGLAWVLGAANPSADASAFVPSSDAESDPDSLIFSFRRADEAHSDPGTNIRVIYGDDMNMAGWNTAVHDGSNVTITVDDDFYGPGLDRVEVRINWGAFAGDRGFVRLEVDIAE